MEHKLQLVEEKYSADKEIAKKRQLCLHKLQQMSSSLYSQVREMETVIDVETGEEVFVSGDYFHFYFIIIYYYLFIFVYLFLYFIVN